MKIPIKDQQNTKSMDKADNQKDESGNLNQRPDDNIYNIDGTESNPEVFIVKKNKNAKSNRREFIANSLMAGSAIPLALGTLSGCEKDKDKDDDKVVKSIHGIATRYYYAEFIFSPDGNILASFGTQESTINLWSIPELKLLKTIKIVEKSTGIKDIKFSPDGKLLVVNSYCQLHIWSIPQGVLLNTVEEDEDTGYQISYFDISHDSKTIVYSKYPETKIKISSLPDGQLLNTIEDSHSYSSSYRFSRDGSKLTSFYKGTVKIWTFPELALYKTFDIGVDYTVFKFSPDEKTIASVDNGTIKLWSFPDGILMRSIDAGPVVGCLSFSHDGKILASSSGFAVKLWSMSDGSLLYTLNEHTGNVNWISFSPDEYTIASCQAETILVWSLKDGGVRLANKIDVTVDNKDHNRYVCFSPDGKVLASSYCRLINFWYMPDCTEVSTGSCICNTVCSCNTVSTGNGSDICTCNSIETCTCNNVCTCNAVVETCGCDSHGSTYWYPC